ncbi:hypothetical protein C7293_10865 [filamentous cyanobacterium CCT1]|nr:hypothetical protein C7293_10865 [filamentous cyanobacterium CCT1]PSN76760.1 hypothetical protein C8B47_25610 [filamentous cyanobacterium CCP4]
MKERFMGVGLGVGAALTLGIVWPNSAQAFSLGRSVTATNTIKMVDTQEEKIFEAPRTVTVGSGLELEQFGGIWDINLNNNSILFSINSRFGNVTSGDDIYRFMAPNFGGPGQKLLVGANPLFLGKVDFKIRPTITVLSGNWLEVVFPLTFAQDLASIPDGDLSFRIDLKVQEPTPVPTPALLPGLMGMGLAALRKRCKDSQAD